MLSLCTWVVFEGAFAFYHSAHPINHHHAARRPLLYFSSSSTKTRTLSSSSPCQGTKTRIFDKSPNSDIGTTTTDLTILEQEILSAVQERLDKKRIVDALVQNDRPTASEVTPQWHIALAAAFSTSALCLVLTSYNTFLAGVVFLVVFFIGIGDPLEEDNAAGALARIIGRSTIRSVQASQPKLKALARAIVVEEEEILQLQEEIKQLKEENARLRKWQQQREQVDQQLSQISFEELKNLARSYNLPVGGTKAELFMRLLEAEIIIPDISER